MVDRSRVKASVSELTKLGRQVAVRDLRAKSQRSVPSNALLPGAQQISSEAKGGVLCQIRY